MPALTQAALDLDMERLGEFELRVARPQVTAEAKQHPHGLHELAPRHQFAMWVSGNRLLTQGGCTPAMRRSTGAGHIISGVAAQP